VGKPCLRLLERDFWSSYYYVTYLEGNSYTHTRRESFSRRVSMWDGVRALVTLEGLSDWVPKPQVNIEYIIHQNQGAYLSPKTTRGWDGDSGQRSVFYTWGDQQSHDVVHKQWVIQTISMSTNLETAFLVVSHQGLAVSQRLSHQVGARDAWVSHHVTYHLTHHLTSPMIHHMTCTWLITWLITWPLDLENKSQSTCSAKIKKIKGKCSMG
jgi:hypothetical protein